MFKWIDATPTSIEVQWKTVEYNTDVLLDDEILSGTVTLKGSDTAVMFYSQIYLGRDVTAPLLEGTNLTQRHIDTAINKPVQVFTTPVGVRIKYVYLCSLINIAVDALYTVTVYNFNTSEVLCTKTIISTEVINSGTLVEFGQISDANSALDGNTCLAVKVTSDSTTPLPPFDIIMLWEIGGVA